MLTLLKSGDRVGVVHSIFENTVKMLGYGVYLGQQVPEVGIDLTADLISKGEGKAPAVKLDSGHIVYGWECAQIESEHWLDERFRNYKVEIIDVQKIRADSAGIQ